jgi:Tol biopolymer transport system component
MREEINQICLINADGTGFKQLTDVTTNAYYPTVSPDGESVVYAVNKYDDFDLYMLVLSSSKLFQLTSNIGNAFSPDFSPDGRSILFLNRAAEGPSALWVMESTGANARLLYAGPNTIVGAAWSPDGHTIAFAMAVDRLFTYEIFLLDVNTPDRAPRRLSHDLADIGGSLDWSPDGRDLLIYAGPVNAREVYRLDAGTGDASQLTFGGNNAAAAYSPDGQWIVYNSLRNDFQADLFIMRADGHSTRQLTDDPEPDWQPQWGP